MEFEPGLKHRVYITRNEFPGLAARSVYDRENAFTRGRQVSFAGP